MQQYQSSYSNPLAVRTLSQYNNFPSPICTHITYIYTHIYTCIHTNLRGVNTFAKVFDKIPKMGVEFNMTKTHEKLKF